jgi:TolB protein
MEVTMKTFWIAALFLAVSTFSVIAQDTPDTLPGTIAYIGADFNVFVLGNSQTPVALTNDASDRERYQFPTWSTDGRLAFFCCDLNYTQSFSLRAYVASSDLTAGKLLYSAEREGFTYAAWAPANCDEGANCRDLAVLVNRPSSTFKVELIRSGGTSTSSRTVGTGVPFYFSWNRDGRHMLWFRNNETLSVFDAGTDQSVGAIAAIPRFFQAPAWSPADERAAAVFLEDSGNTTALVTVDGADRQVLRRGLRGVTAFSWSPDGRYLAYRQFVPGTGLSAVEVLDSRTGETAALSGAGQVVSFFWAPDSSKLAYVIPAFESGPSAESGAQRISGSLQQEQELMLSWQVLTLSDSTSRTLTRFVPTDSMLYMLTYFDQFNQSHNIWSPDSRYLLYAERLPNGAPPAISIVDTIASASQSRVLAHGEFGVWSYD